VIRHIGLSWNFSQGEIHEELRFRPRYERRRADSQFVRPELLHAHDISHGLALDAPGNNMFEALQRQFVEHILGMGEQVAARHIDGPTKQDLGIQPRGITATR
jgi:hypothetical protein